MPDAPALPEDVDAALRELISSIVETLEGMLVGVYLEGSFAWRNPVATSDLDLRIVVDEMPTDSQRAELEAARERTQLRLGREVGLHLDRLADLMRVGALRFQRSSWLAGEDVRAKVPMKTIDAFVRDAMLTAHDLIVSARTHHGQRATYPLTAPLPGAEFRGYDIRPVLDRGQWVPSSKRLVSNVTAGATALIAQRAKVFVFTKGEVPGLYAEHVGGEWAAFVADVHEGCRVKAGYLLPQDAAGRVVLTALCDRAVAFETALLAESVPFLRALAASADERDRAAGERRLAEIDQLPET